MPMFLTAVAIDFDVCPSRPRVGSRLSLLDDPTRGAVRRCRIVPAIRNASPGQGTIAT